LKQRAQDITRLAKLMLLTAALAACGAESKYSAGRSDPGSVMLILRGIASEDSLRGQLDDASAVEYARRVGFRGEVLDVAGDTGRGSEQVKMALARIRQDDTVGAIYGFSGGGYNARAIWQQLHATERGRLRKVVVVGSPGVSEGDFQGAAEVTIKQDPPEGHMAGPKLLLDSLGATSSGARRQTGRS
jgi:hypothetical protein